jgi:hypothetical protein
MRNTTQVRYSIRESKSRWLALKLNIRNKEGRSGERERLRLLPLPSAAPLRGYPTDSSVRDIVTERLLL